MKNLLLTSALFFLFLSAFSQENINSRRVLAKFDKYYNASQYDSIFSMFSNQAKIALPYQKTIEFLSQQLKPKFGNIVKRTFTENKAPFTVYKTEFEQGVLSLSVAVDDNQAIGGLYAQPYVEDSSPKLERTISEISLPFKGEWTVFWGGDTKELNGHHVGVKFQKNAFDIVILDKDNKRFRTTGKTNEDYYAFGQALFAPCDAEVVLAVDGVKDNMPGILNPLFATGNSVILKTKNNEYMLLAHFRQGSLKVKQGDIVKRGQALGLSGNSGNSSEPHLHFHVQNIEDMNVATGVKCYFDKIVVNGIEKMDYSPVKGEKIRN